jgi:hypothetical protein
MKRQIWLPITTFIVLAASLWSPVAADCRVNGVVGADGTAASDTIVCDNNPAVPVDVVVAGGTGGNDQITVNSSNQLIVAGDATVSSPVSVATVNTAGNDTITINGNTSALVVGDYTDPDVTGGIDIITINGSAAIVYGDMSSGNATGGGDTIIINGTVTGQVTGDSEAGAAPVSNQVGGIDTIIINGTAGSVAGEDFLATDADVGGGDIIIINGSAQVNGNVSGEENAAIGGNDEITVGVGAVITGIVSGGNAAGDFDTLTLTGNTSDVAGYNQVQALIGCNPCNGSVTVDGNTYTFQNFEQLINLLMLINPGVPKTVVITLNPEPPEPVLLCGDSALLMYRLWTGELEFYSGMQLNPVQPFLVGKVSRGDLENGLRTFTIPDTEHPGWHVDVLDMTDPREGYFAQAFDDQDNLVGQSCPFTIS